MTNTNEDLHESMLVVYPDLVAILRKEIYHDAYTKGLHERDVKALALINSQNKLIEQLSKELRIVTYKHNQLQEASS